MLNIDKKIFDRNLILTQEYCQQQINVGQNDNAKVFRSYNPVIKSKLIFSFEMHHFNFEIRPNLNYCTLTKWSVDPISNPSENLVKDLFDQQIKFKKDQRINTTVKNFSGDILISKIDGTVVDGASEVQSLGLIDLYDMPPIDTWFYLLKTNIERLLFAWIPEEFKYDANMAIDVNCVDCINWFQIFFPIDYQENSNNKKG